VAGPYGTFGNAFGGSTAGWRPPANPFAPEREPDEGWDRDLFETNQGRPAFGLFANAARATGNNPYADWLESGGTQNDLWTDYLGQFTARQDPTFAFTNYLAENDPYLRYMRRSYADRGVANPASLAPFAALVNSR
jgi:hypothetical protein